MGWLFDREGDDFKPYLGRENDWPVCRRCGDYYPMGSPQHADNCITVADAVRQQLGGGDYRYVIVEGDRVSGEEIYCCCGRHLPQGTRVATRECGRIHICHHDLVKVEGGYTVYRARYNGVGASYTCSPVRFDSLKELGNFYQQEYAGCGNLKIRISTSKGI